MASDPHGNLKSRIYVSLVLVSLFLALGVMGFMKLKSLKKKPEQKGEGRPRTAVRVEEARRGEYREVLEGYGVARALREVELPAEVAGVVTWLSPNLEAGAVVAAGEELVRLDTRDYEQARDSAQARLDQARAAESRLNIDLDSAKRRLSLARRDFESATRELERVGGLADTGVLTRSDLDRQRIVANLSEKEVLGLEAQAASLAQDLLRGKAEVTAANSSLARASTDLARTKIAAPFSGRVVRRMTNLAARVTPGTPLLELVDPSRIEVPVALGASRFGEVDAGAVARIRMHAGSDPVWTGTVSRISPTVDSKDRTFFAYLEVRGDERGAAVVPGAFVLAEIDGRLHADVIPVPRSAFISDRVYVAEPTGTGEEALIRERRPVVARLLPEVVLIGEGLTDGDLVVVTSLEQVAEGSRVLLVRDPSEGESRDR